MSDGEEQGRSVADHAPVARREDVVELMHGEPLADPYRWLEDAGSPEVIAWSAAQTAFAEAEISALPGREELSKRIDALLRIGTVEPPTVVAASSSAPRYFYRRQRPDQDQPVLLVRDGVAERTLLDPNRMSADGTVSVDWWVPSPDGRLLAYGMSHGGDEESTLRVLEVASGVDLPATEVISRTRYASIAWLPDGSGFYYSRYPAKGTVPDGEERYRRLIHEHRLGRDAGADPVVFGEGRAVTDMPGVDISPGGRWLVATVHMGWSRREAYLLDRRAGGAARWIPLAIPEQDAVYEVSAYDDHLLVRTNDGAPNYELFRVDPEAPDRARWQKLLPEGPDVLVFATQIGRDLLAIYTRDACSIVRRFDAEGRLNGEVPLPTLGTVSGIHGAWNGREAFFDFTSFTVPAMVLRLDLDSGESSVWAEVRAPIDPSAFVVEQMRATSRDGTRIPMFVVHKKGLARDGTAPTLLGGYGGFNISQMPQWSGAGYLLLERGGVTVTANLRGGGEYGESWHRAGMLENKQNVFDDFVACAEHLIRERVTAPGRLAISGGSNGGLLVGAAITQRPDLFRAAVCAVPLLDMLRYHRFLIAKLWIPEYGSPEDARQFAWLRAYSPYHAVKAGTRYPSVLFTTAEGDTRVDPLHARKMAALLQWAQPAGSSSERPILLRIEAKAGHGAGKPVSKRIDEQALIYGFLLWQLGVEV
ncbi:MAG TPA: prolyl oligopeptidase family serine peptidase [Polyangiaceae bacterium]